MFTFGNKFYSQIEIMKNSLQKQLKAYTALTAALGASSTTNAAVQITTFNHIGSWDETYDVDIDGNGVVDFKILNNYMPNLASLMLGMEGVNYAIGSSNYIAALNNGDIVSSGKSFYKTDGVSYWSYGLLAWYIYNDTKAYGGNFINFTGDKFVGVKFDISGNWHYGWLRFRKFEPNLSEWILVDAGWEDEADTGLTIDAPENSVSVEEITPMDFNITASDNYLSITTEALNSQLDVFDVNGKHLYNQAITTKNTNIPHQFR